MVWFYTISPQETLRGNLRLLFLGLFPLTIAQFSK